MQIPTEVSAWLEPRYVQIKEAIENGATIDSNLWSYLQDSEDQLIDLMNGHPPGPNAPGNIEECWVLYFLNNKTPTWLKSVLKIIGMPSSTITPGDWTQWDNTLNGQGVLMGDGSLVAYAWYAVVDPGWSIAMINYLLLHLGIKKPHDFGTTPATVTISGQNKLNIALFGDWGTGAYKDGNLAASPSQMIAQQVVFYQPDVAIHLGDVYYAGLSSEEQNKLVNCWPSAPKGNFTLNSNHEMYDGANGLFDTALCNSIFSNQQNTSYFKILFGNWIIIGLDSAYYDTSSMFMSGAIVDPAQISFLQEAGAMAGKKICILTHHNPIDTIGQNKSDLWTQVINALGREPDYWYWGHVHNGMVYTAQSAGGNVNCRCLGNAAIPIGNASWLAGSPSTVSFYTNKPLANPTVQQQLRVMNCFAMLEFSNDTVLENWYYQDGSLAWHS